LPVALTIWLFFHARRDFIFWLFVSSLALLDDAARALSVV